MKMQPKAWRSAGLFEKGVGTVVVARFKGDGRVEAGFFLVDVWCLGVKVAGFRRFESADELQEELLDRLFAGHEPMEISAEAGRKLVEEAVAFAGRLGIAPCRDYKKGCRVFGGIATTACVENFVFGKDGKPLYVQGQFDSPDRRERILRALEARCGRDGFHYIVVEDEPFEEFEDEAGADGGALEGISDEPDSAGLESLAARVQAEEPGTRIILNRSGEKVSEMISEVAQPLLEMAPDCDTMEEILHLTVLAWNFTVLPPDGQQELLDLIIEANPGPETAAAFALLAARSIELFPRNRPAIHKIEVDECPAGRINLRVISTPPENRSAGRRRERAKPAPRRSRRVHLVS
jgi:hypothetical protein